MCMSARFRYWHWAGSMQARGEATGNGKIELGLVGEVQSRQYDR